LFGGEESIVQFDKIEKPRIVRMMFLGQTANGTYRFSTEFVK
jgi:hypothetical protein